ncbi:hypothetical protein [Gordonia sihwensis]|nr:hypothetical protein [Gordonia sihwensis]
MNRWLTQHITEAIRPITDAITRDTLDRLRIDITIRLSIDEDTQT